VPDAAKAVKIRPARTGEMPAIRGLIGRYPDKLVQEPLPGLRSFFVAHFAGELVGCCALEVYSLRLAEIRSLAVAPELTNQGIGSRLVAACRKRAVERGVKQVLTVTGQAGFFERMGFSTFKQERLALFWDVDRPFE
jgi:amino-acid N-acetyltransferase